jgi:hypothetical protein
VPSSMPMQGTGFLRVSVRAPKSDDDPNPRDVAWLRFNPWLAYGCAPGTRLLIVDPSDLEARHCRFATVKRPFPIESSFPDSSIVRPDNPARDARNEETCDARPDTVIPAPRIRYAPGEKLVCVHKGKSVDATVLPFARLNAEMANGNLRSWSTSMVINTL